MKYQLLTALIAATVSAGPVFKHQYVDQCPSGYSPSVYYVTVTSTPTREPTTTTTLTASSTSSVVITETLVRVSTKPSGLADESATSIFSSTSTPEASIPETSQAPIPVTTSAEAPKTQNPVPATTSAAEEPTSSASAAQTAGKSSASVAVSGRSAGEATYYDGNVAGGTCSFSGYTLPSHIFGSALSIDAWDDASKCGACVAIQGPGGNTIKAMIVDQCPSCKSNHLDLFQDAFSSLSALSAGNIDISWSYTSCELDGPLKLKNKDGTSQYWFSMQVVNANEPVTKLEVSTDGGSSWQATERTYYNYFEKKSGFGTENVDVRVTGQSGKSVVVKNVGCESEAVVTAASNL
ncbi:hypothetical protein N7492_000481 [Penicillium capsulatum]|uniref:Expansin-like EG45 domain-containing protein n=1 Tax=Penicillium capsulatum TaxID=69766 RepID=A0A9W9ITM0_9EURO|nr:hypothetical protein N7492_000481 [Penicillium capsulatum]KAJ6130460.1 hypothetical protein N7512_003240 [Penicillium capsulatum]